MADHYYEGQVQYIGPRFVPRFATPIEWNKEKQYEQLEMVVYLGNTYTSRKPVPAGIEITNDDYWALTGNYNYQVEAYRQEVERYKGDIIDQFNNTVSDIDDKLKNVIKISDINNMWKIIMVSDTAGNDKTADGTVSKPFKTLEKAVEFGNKFNYARYNFSSDGTYMAPSSVIFKSVGLYLYGASPNVTIIVDTSINSKFLFIEGYSQDNKIKINHTDKSSYISMLNCIGRIRNTEFLHELSFEMSLMQLRETITHGLSAQTGSKIATIRSKFYPTENPSSPLLTLIDGTFIPNVIVTSGAELTISFSGITEPKPFGEPANIFCDKNKDIFFVDNARLFLLIQDDDILETLDTKYDYLVNNDYGIVASYLNETQATNIANAEVYSTHNASFKWLSEKTK